MKNRLFSFLGIVFLVFVQGCTPPPPAVTFSVFGDPAELAAYESLVEAFHEQNPQIKVQLQHIPSQSDYRRRLATAFSAGTPPDVMLINYRRFASFAGQGGLEPLDTYIEQSEIINRSDFFPIALSSFEWRERLWCVPQNVSSLVVYYNRDLFDEAGVSYPEDNWRWEDFMRAAQELTQDHDRDGQIDQYGAGIAPNLFRLAPFIWQDGLDIVDDPLQPSRLTLDQPEVLTVFQRFIALQTVDQVVPNANAEAAEPSENRWLNGGLAMYFNSRRGVPTYRTIDSFEWDVVRLPITQDEWIGILHSDAYCLAAAAENKEAAWQFIEFANGVQGQTIVARSGRTVPSRPDVAQSPAFLDGLPPANAQTFIDTVDQLRGVPVMAGWTAIEEITGKEIERAFYGQVSAEEAAAAAIELTAPYFENNQ
ncbi:MAG: sugar ABC transporter substrate-binding protein [Ardenticatenaceae bacterium]|nr:sugar ABC transporter substrate-binding protein [Ardenticatenaceae bacterium]